MLGLYLYFYIHPIIYRSFAAVAHTELVSLLRRPGQARPQRRGHDRAGRGRGGRGCHRVRVRQARLCQEAETENADEHRVPVTERGP